MVGTVAAVGEHAINILVDENGHAFIPIELLPQHIRDKIKVGSRIVITETKRSEDDTGEWKVRLLRVGEHISGRKKPEKIR